MSDTAPKMLAVLAAGVLACGPGVGSGSGSGSQDGGGATDTDADPTDDATGEAESTSSAGSTGESAGCPASDLPPPFCHVAVSYGVEAPGTEVIPSLLTALESPGVPTRLLIRREQTYSLVDAEDFGVVHGETDTADLSDVARFLGDFDGDGITDLGSAPASEQPFTLYSGVDLGVLAVSSAPPSPAGGWEYPSGRPAGAIDYNGDGIDEVVTVELGHRLVVWAHNTGSLERVAEYDNAIDPCAPNAFLRADFTGDGVPDLAVPESVNVCWDMLDVDESMLEMRVIPSPMPVRLDRLASTPQESESIYPGAVGDLNGDGRPDVVLADESRVTLAVSTDAGLTVTTMVHRDEVGGDAFPFGNPSVSDVDGDGLADIAVGGFTADSANDEFRIYFGGGFDGDYYAFEPRCRITGLVDLNGDGRAEIMGRRTASESIEVFIYWSQ